MAFNINNGWKRIKELLLLYVILLVFFLTLRLNFEDNGYIDIFFIIN